MRQLKTGLALALSLTLAISTLETSVAAKTPKANQACSKKGEVRVVKTSKLKCTRVGEKLIWKIQKSKNQNSQQSAPQALPSATPSPATSTSPTPSASEKPAPTPTPVESKRPFSPPTKKPNAISELDPETAWYFAWQSMDEYRKRNEALKAQYDIRISSNYKAEVKEVIIEGLDAGSSFWSDFWKPNQPILVILGTEKDTDFWKAELANLYDARWHQSKDEMFNNLQEFFRVFGSQNNSAGASWFSNRPNMNFPYGSALQVSDIRQNNWQTSPHEYTHLVQGLLGYSFNLNGMGAQWMSEGQAEHVGLFLTKATPEQYLAYRNLRFSQQWRSPDQSNLKTPNQIHEAIRDRAQKPIYNAYYSYGAAAMEALVSIHGHGSIIEYFKRIQSGVWWPDAFQQIFGMTHEAYLREVSTYLSKLRSNVTGEITPEEIISENYAKYIETKKKAHSSINSVAVASFDNRVNLKYMVGDAFPKDFESLNRNLADYSARVFSYFLDKKIDTTIYLYTEKEDKLLRTMSLWRESEWWPDIQVWLDRWKQGVSIAQNIGLAANYLTDSVNLGGHAGIAMASTGTTSTESYYNIHVLPHEFFHVIQDYFFRPRGVTFPESNSYDVAFPPVFREGSANTFSIAVTFQNFEDYRKFYDKYSYDIVPRVAMLRNIRDEADVVAALQRSLDRKDPEAFEAAYFIGGLLFEWLIAEYGVSKYRQLLTDPGYGTTSFNALVTKVLGYDSNELYRRAAPHILSGLTGK